jgi:hypothetical protein
MKRTLPIFVCLLLFTISVQAQQGVGINATGAAPNASAILDVSSTTQGQLTPRMTTAQRNAIAAPAEGLLIYNLDCKDFNYYNGTIWVSTAVNIPVATTAVYNGATSFIANWNGSGGATSYSIDVSTSPTFATFVPGYNNLNVGSVTTYTVTGLTCGSTYYFRVRANNACGASAPSNAVSILVYCCPNYAVTSIPFVAAPAGGWTTIAMADDEISAALPIGFSFTFYCVPYTSFYIGSNGFITFTNTVSTGCCSGQVVPDVTEPNNLIACPWTDLDPSSGGTVRYQTVGVAPNRRLLVRWTNVPFFGVATTVNTYIAIYETTNVVEIFSQTCNAVVPGNIVTFGVENGAGTQATTPAGRNSATFNAPNEGWRFN